MSKEKDGAIMSSTKKKTPLAHIMFLIAGALFLIYFLISQGVPSLGNSITSIMPFIAELFIFVLVICFYFFFLFGAKNCEGTTKAIAPSLLVLIVVGPYSMNFGSDVANSIISNICKILFTLILVCGFAFLFVRHKLLGLTFAWSSVIYAAFATLSYVIVLIISLVNGGAFSLAKMFETLVYVSALSLLFIGGYYLNRNKSMTSL